MPNNLPIIEARKERRRFERRFFSRTRSTEDRKDFRKACRKTDKLIRESRSAYVRSKVADVAYSPRLLWRTVRQLLHPGVSMPSTWFEGMDTKILAGNLGQFFSDKIDCIREMIKTSPL